jgi:uncharacterized membrane protein (UPF0136 family)
VTLSRDLDPFVAYYFDGRVGEEKATSLSQSVSGLIGYLRANPNLTALSSHVAFGNHLILVQKVQ